MNAYIFKELEFRNLWGIPSELNCSTKLTSLFVDVGIL